jgi:hypothetical protein
MVELIESHGHLADFWPKFHCELQWIERLWGNWKRYTRENNDGTIETLEKNLKFAKENVPKELYIKWETTARRWIHMYATAPADLTFKQRESVVKKYKSHRIVPESAYKDFDKM